MNTNRHWIVLFLFPTIAIFLMFYAYPLVTVIVTSFTTWRIAQSPEFIGIANYVKLSTDNVFKASFVNVLKWLALYWTIFVGLGILTALLTVRKSGFNRFFRVVYLIPNMIARSALAMTFYFVFQPSFGIVNQFIRSLGFTEFNRNWFGQLDSAFYAVTAITIFFSGVIMLLVSSEISSIPDSVIESARIDGAKQWQIDFYIILPMIRNIVGTSLILATTQVLRTFESIVLTTSGGPGNSTMNLSLYLYRQAMLNNKIGYANAIGTVTIIIGVVAITGINRFFKMGTSQHD